MNFNIVSGGDMGIPVSEIKLIADRPRGQNESANRAKAGNDRGKSPDW